MKIVRFFNTGMNIVDLLGILPYFASLCLSLLTTSTTTGQTKYQDEMRRIAQIFRIMRILRSGEKIMELNLGFSCQSLLYANRVHWCRNLAHISSTTENPSKLLFKTLTMKHI